MKSLKASLRSIKQVFSVGHCTWLPCNKHSASFKFCYSLQHVLKNEATKTGIGIPPGEGSGRA